MSEVAKKFKTKRELLFDIAKWIKTDPSVIYARVTDDDAINTARQLARIQGLLVGTSSGANVWTAIQMAKKYGEDKVIATILPDRVERYFSTSLI